MVIDATESVETMFFRLPQKLSAFDQQLPTKPSSRVVSEAALNVTVMKIGNSVVVLYSGSSSHGEPRHNGPPLRYLDGRYVNA